MARVPGPRLALHRRDRAARRAAADGADPDLLALQQARASSTRSLGLILFHTAFGLPFAIFLLRNFFIGIPKDILESARIDGASELAIFLRLILPLGLPAIASLAIFQFLWTWNDLLVALTLRPRHAADHGRDLLPAAPVRLEHRADRAGGVHLAGDPARRLLRLPALLRPGPAGRLGQVSRARTVRDRRRRARGLRRVRDAAARRGRRPARSPCSAPEPDPAALWRRRAAAIRQRRMRSESDGHCLPAVVPGARGAGGAAAALAAPLVARCSTATTRRVDEFLEHVEELRERTGWDESFRPARVERVRAVDGGFDLDGARRLPARARRARATRACTCRTELAGDPRVVHAYEPHEYADEVAVVGAGHGRRDRVAERARGRRARSSRCAGASRCGGRSTCRGSSSRAAGLAGFHALDRRATRVALLRALLGRRRTRRAATGTSRSPRRRARDASASTSDVNGARAGDLRDRASGAASSTTRCCAGSSTSTASRPPGAGSCSTPDCTVPALTDGDAHARARRRRGAVGVPGRRHARRARSTRRAASCAG